MPPGEWDNVKVPPQPSLDIIKLTFYVFYLT